MKNKADTRGTIKIQLSFKQVLRIAFKSSKVAAGGLLLLKNLSSIAHNVLILVLAEFLDCVLAIFNSGIKSMPYILLIIAIYIALQLFIWLEPNISDMLNARLLINLRYYCNKMVLDKYSKLQYRYIEDKAALELMNRVVPNVETRIVSCFLCYLRIVGFVVKIAGLIILLTSEAFVPAFGIVICAVPLFCLAVKSGRASYEAAKEVTNSERKAGYLSEIMFDRSYVYERKLFQYGRYVNDMWKEKFDVARILKLKTSIKWYIKSKVGSVFTAIIAVVSAVCLIDPVLCGDMSVGIYISIVGSVYTLVQVMAWEFMQNIDALANTHEYMRDFNEFYELSEEIETGKEEFLNEFKSLEFDHVYFKYPNTNEYILKDLCLRIEAKKQYSIVGVNGAGKTTMIKLVLGLYDNFEGIIRLNDINIKEYSKKQIRTICTAVFQDFAKYALTIRDNVMLGGLYNTNQIDEKDIERAIEDVGMKDIIAQYEKGLDTRLGSDFRDGQDFSGGQWQRLAIARNLMGNSELTFFDEPTASLDPIAENQFYQSLQFIAQKKTIVIISHRLAVAKYADCIYVIDNGAVSEAGDFKQLMKSGQGFARMYQSQKRWYDEKK